MRFKKFSRNKRYNEIVDDLGNDRGSNDKPVKNTKVNTEINSVARRNLYKSSYAIKVDPYNELNQASTVYDMVTSPNKTYSPDYLGEINLDGGYTSQYLTAKNSKLLEVADAQLAALSINYRFLNLDNRYENVTNSPTTTDAGGTNRTVIRGEMLLRKMYDAVNEALSQLDATTFTYLTMNTEYAVISSIYIPGLTPDYTFTATKDKYNSTDTYKSYLYTDPAAVILLTGLAYQIPLLNAILGFNYVNKTKFYEQQMLHMNYDRETDPLNQFFGQLMKSTFTTKLDSIILSLKGEYVDADFIKTLNMITQVNSRDADDIIDPINEVVGAIVEPRLTAIFSYKSGLPAGGPTQTNAIEFIDAYDGQASLIWLQGENTEFTYGTQQNVITLNCTDVFTTKLGTFKLRDYVTRIAVDYSVTGLLHWARNYNSKPLSDELAKIEDYDTNHTGADNHFALSSTDIVVASCDPTQLYNRLGYAVDGIAGILNKLKTAFPDLRTVFDKLQPVGIVNWTKGVELIISTKFDQTTEHFIIIDDIYKSVLSGPTNIKFSATTGRWTSNTLWDKYEGVPEYDKMSGGQFISFSGKTLDCASNGDCNLEYIPKLYNYNAIDKGFNHRIVCTTRHGDLISLMIQASQPITTMAPYRRLAILPIHESEQFRVPTMNHILYRHGSATDSALQQVIQSWMEMNVIRTFGMFKRIDNTYTLKTSLIALYTYEILSSASEMITYAKTAGMFRGTSEGIPAVGFKGLTINKG